MTHDPDFHPRVYSTGDGERSTAGSNYGDWRPNHPPTPHGYDFEKRFEHGPTDWTAPDPDYRRLREEHEREPDAHDPHGLQAQRRNFEDDFNRWRQERATSRDTDDQR